MIDSHCHLHDEKFADDLKEVLKRADDAHITHMITIGCDIKTTLRAKELAHEMNQVYFSAGFHPHEAKFLDDEAFHKLKELALDKKCVAIGECGLDFYYLHSSEEEQIKAFRRQILLAKELKLPLIIHLRDAFEPFLSILNEHKDYAHRVLLHCFSQGVAQAKILEKMGCFISLSGIITFKKPGELIEVAREVALDRLLIETDCPYLAPQPHRGQRNEPAYLTYTLKAVASARGEPEEVVSAQISKNCALFFGLDT